MKIGDLRHRISIEKMIKVKDGMGGFKPSTYTAFATVWAFVQPLQSKTDKEAYQSQQIQAKLSHKITIRYLQGVTPDMRVNYQGRVFNIQSIVNVDERNREMILNCVEE